jgi:hypothetical protein
MNDLYWKQLLTLYAESPLPRVILAMGKAGHRIGDIVKTAKQKGHTVDPFHIKSLLSGQLPYTDENGTPMPGYIALCAVYNEDPQRFCLLPDESELQKIYPNNRVSRLLLFISARDTSINELVSLARNFSPDFSRKDLVGLLNGGSEAFFINGGPTYAWKTLANVLGRQPTEINLTNEEISAPSEKFNPVGIGAYDKDVEELAKLAARNIQDLSECPADEISAAAQQITRAIAGYHVYYRGARPGPRTRIGRPYEPWGSNKANANNRRKKFKTRLETQKSGTQTQKGDTTPNLEKAAEILRNKLPELNIRILGPKTLGGSLFNIAVGPKIAVELPMEQVGLRFTLLRELSDRIGISFASDSSSLKGACTSAEDSPEKVCQAIHLAADAGKLDSLTVKYLDQHTSAQDRDRALQMYRRGGGFTEELFNRVTATKRPDYS